jgi:hypothetical protein
LGSQIWLVFGAESSENGAAHSRDRRTLAGPYFPLRSALRKEHFEPGYGFDAAPRGELQKSRFDWTVNEIKDKPAIQFARRQRRPFNSRKHADRRSVYNRVEKFLP